MKYFFTLCLSMIFQFSFGQLSMLDIEKELMRDYKKIIYWNDSLQKKYDIVTEDSLDDVNINFKNKLLTYTGTTAQTLSYKFQGLKNLGVHIVSSADGSFKIYSWNTKSKDGIQYVEAVYQYKLNRKVFSKLKIKEKESDPGHWCDEIFTIKANLLTTYVAFYKGTASDSTKSILLKAYELHDTGFKDEIPFFKTKNDFTNEIKLEYLAKSEKTNIDELIFYDELKHTLNLPMINKELALTKRRANYQFNGKHFEQ